MQCPLSIPVVVCAQTFVSMTVDPAELRMQLESAFWMQPTYMQPYKHVGGRFCMVRKLSTCTVYT